MGPVIRSLWRAVVRERDGRLGRGAVGRPTPAGAYNPLPSRKVGQGAGRHRSRACRPNNNPGRNLDDARQHARRRLKLPLRRRSVHFIRNNTVGSSRQFCARTCVFQAIHERFWTGHAGRDEELQTDAQGPTSRPPSQTSTGPRAAPATQQERNCPVCNNYGNQSYIYCLS